MRYVDASWSVLRHKKLDQSACPCKTFKLLCRQQPFASYPNAMRHPAPAPTRCDKHSAAGWRHARACTLDASSLNELFPRPDNDPDLEFAWATRGAPVATRVARSQLGLLTARRRWSLPSTKHLRFRRNYLVQHRCACVVVALCNTPCEALLCSAMHSSAMSLHIGY